MYMIQQMRDAVRAYKNKALKILDKIEKVYDTYLPDSAQREEERLRGEMHTARVEAENTIYSAHQRGANYIKSWFTLDGSKLTDDVKLLEIGVTPAQYRQLLEKYKSNFTMLSALARYADNQNAQARANERANGNFVVSDAYSTTEIPTLEKMVAEWDMIGAGAVGLLDAIDGKGKYADRFMRSFTLGSMDSSIDSLGAGFDL